MSKEKELSVTEEQLVVFRLAGETYGIDIANVHEIIRMQNITVVPRTPRFVEGVINLRGRIIPVIDLRKRFSIPPEERTQNTRIMVVEVGNVTVGMIVDSVMEVLRLPAANIEPPPPIVDGVDVAYLRGVGKVESSLVILLNMDRVLHQDEQIQLQTAVLEETAAARESQ
ncbi:MAG: chemotaxis protein CheW [Bacillota bacterium]